MALIDVKIKEIKRANGQTEVLVNVYRGAITTEDEALEDGTTQPVTRYRRAGKVASKNFIVDGEYTEDQVHKFVAAKVNQLAEQLGHTVIDKQKLDKAQVTTAVDVMKNLRETTL